MRICKSIKDVRYEGDLFTRFNDSRPVEISGVEIFGVKFWYSLWWERYDRWEYRIRSYSSHKAQRQQERWAAFRL